MFDLKLKELKREYKFIIDKEIYSKIDTEIYWQNDFEQVNYYFDKQNVLLNNNITVRVRSINNCNKLQVKVPVQTKGSLSEKREYEDTIDMIPENIPGAVISKKCGINLSDLCCAGTLTTLRKTCNLFQGAELFLDYNKYLDFEDFEVEIEVKGEYDINTFLKKYELDKQSSNSVGKFSRFMDRYLKIRGIDNA